MKTKALFLREWFVLAAEERALIPLKREASEFRRVALLHNYFALFKHGVSLSQRQRFIVQEVDRYRLEQI